MRIKIVALLFLLTLMVGMSVASAQNFSEAGAVLNISWGEGSTQFKSRLVVKSDSGRDVASPSGVINVSRNEGTIGQIIFAHDGKLDPNRIVFSWSTLAAPVLETDWHEARFDPKTGWVFRVDPSQYVSSGILDTPLHLRVLIKDGKAKYIRVIITITYGYDSQVSREVLFIRPYDPAPSLVAVASQPPAIDPSLLEIKRVLGIVSDNQQALGDRLNADVARDDIQEARINRLEQAWESQASAVVQPPVVAPSPCKTIEESLRERHAGKNGYVFYSSYPVQKSWWLLSSKGWMRAPNDLVIKPTEEKYWLYDASDLQRKGWIGFGFGEGNSKPTTVHPLNSGLNTLEVR